jgi:hypothetical protein
MDIAHTERESDLDAGGDEIPLDDPRHGTLSLYNNHGCRCPACRRARRDAAREYRSRAVA